MTRDLEYARQMLDVSRAVVANLLNDHGPDHPRVKDARESAAGWRREVERLERVAAVSDCGCGDCDPGDCDCGKAAA